jgi:hypothetical protein
MAQWEAVKNALTLLLRMPHMLTCALMKVVKEDVVMVSSERINASCSPIFVETENARFQTVVLSANVITVSHLMNVVTTVLILTNAVSVLISAEPVNARM